MSSDLAQNPLVIPGETLKTNDLVVVTSSDQIVVIAPYRIIDIEPGITVYLPLINVTVFLS